jgi:hypothetical protein
MPLDISQLPSANPQSENPLLLELGGIYPRYLSLPEKENGNIPDNFRQNWQGQIDDRVSLISWVELDDANYNDALFQTTQTGRVFFTGSRETAFESESKYAFEDRLRKFFRFYSSNYVNFIFTRLSDPLNDPTVQNQYFQIQLDFEINYNGVSLC